MPVSLAESLRSALARLPPGGALHVGYSGGLDSTVLLHALAQLPAARARGLVALHVDHGLHPASAAWARHCCGTAAALGVEARVLPVQINRAGRGLEAAARAARHAALAAALPADGVLVLAHHADDQSETVLLKLLRGAGPEGLGGMRALRVLPQGWLWRPLLDLPRETLRGYALAQGLEWIEDPTNADLRHARNRLRHEILPALRRHWPPLDASLAHAARHAQAAADYIDEAARRALAELQDSTRTRWTGAAGCSCPLPCATRCCGSGCARSAWTNPRTCTWPNCSASSATRRRNACLASPLPPPSCAATVTCSTHGLPGRTHRPAGSASGTATR